MTGGEKVELEPKQFLSTEKSLTEKSFPPAFVPICIGFGIGGGPESKSQVSFRPFNPDLFTLEHQKPTLQLRFIATSSRFIFIWMSCFNYIFTPIQPYLVSQRATLKAFIGNEQDPIIPLVCAHITLSLPLSHTRTHIPIYTLFELLYSFSTR